MNISIQRRIPRGVLLKQATVGGVAGEWLEPDQSGVPGTLLYLHGGGYFTCSPRTHRPITTAFAKAGLRVFAPDYRLAPEHPFPAAVLDAVASYRGLREAAPHTPIVIAGDSAGGGLTLATILKLRDEGDPLPSAAVLFSPFTDLTGSGPSRQVNDKLCAMFPGTGLEWVSLGYIGDADPRDPLASPLWADLTGLPPLLIHVGACETLLDDSTRLAERARAAGVSVELKIWPKVPHVWQIFHRFIPEGRESLREAAAFLRAALERTG